LVALGLALPALGETRRLAIVVGNNAGTGTVAPLRYAESDAGKMARVLVELGDVNPDDVLLLQGRHTQELEAAIAEARDRVAFFKRSPDVRSVLMFYFSGHSDGEAIELGPDKLAYARLKALLSGTGADVRLVIVDACRSGAGLREKGGKPADAFTIRFADTLQATGEAFITSSAANEAALESSEVMGSYFTHNLISGLRGAADSSGDKLVTLAEAYRYAYDRTVSATAMLSVGGQHPNYDFRLSGQGELVLSSLLKPSASLVMPEAERSLISDLARDQVIAELPSGQARELALPPGQYGVRVFKRGQAWGGRISLSEGARHVVSMEELSPVSSSVVVAAKGGESVTQQFEAPTFRNGSALALSVGFGATGRVLLDPPTAGGPKWQLRLALEPVSQVFASTGGGEFALRLTGQPRIVGLAEMSFDAAPVGGSEAPNEAGMQLRLGYQVRLEWWRLSLSVGLEAGPGFLAQLYGSHMSSFALAGAPHAVLRLRLTSSVSLYAEAEVALLGAEIVDLGWQWFWRSAGSGGLAFTF
jgi:hypothetical protein